MFNFNNKVLCRFYSQVAESSTVDSNSKW